MNTNQENFIYNPLPQPSPDETTNNIENMQTVNQNQISPLPNPNVPLNVISNQDNKSNQNTFNIGNQEGTQLIQNQVNNPQPVNNNQNIISNINNEFNNNAGTNINNNSNSNFFNNNSIQNINSENNNINQTNENSDLNNNLNVFGNIITNQNNNGNINDNTNQNLFVIPNNNQNNIIDNNSNNLYNSTNSYNNIDNINNIGINQENNPNNFNGVFSNQISSIRDNIPDEDYEMLNPQPDNKYINSTFDTTSTALTDLNVDPNAMSVDYSNDPKVLANLDRDEKRKNTITITSEAKVFLLIVVVLFIFIFVMPYIFDAVKNIG